MPEAARLNDAVAGTTAGEHTGHVPPHSPEPFSGEISSGCSGDVFINGMAAATVGSVTTARAGCCGSASGQVAAGSSSVVSTGRPAARRGEALAPHSGEGAATAGRAEGVVGGGDREDWRLEGT